MKLTMLITEGEEYLIGKIKEIPAVLTQGKTIDEVKENLKDALELYLEVMRHEPEDARIITEEEFVLG
ncbi:MAG: type II toxin-antitoxin system HicB family antitoxin [Chitinophagales bacterium]|nr:type II toxin-antitoxin system HicB family antitoxin [Chitinophagales bacterium]